MPPRLSLPSHAQRRALRDSVLQVSGAASVYRRLVQPRLATVVCYHSVAAAEDARCIDPRWRLSPQEFESQVSFLASQRRVVPLADLLATLRSGEDPQPGTVAIAFDDGYRDNLTVAAPILARYDLPATLFLATGHVEASEPQFVDRLYAYWTQRVGQRLRLPGLDAYLRCPTQRARCHRELNARLIVADRDQREDVLRSVASQLGVPVTLPRRLTLTWDEARELVRDHPRVEIGVHTVNHLDLVAHPHRADDELQGSRAAVQAELGVDVRYHSFPFGRSTPSLRARVRQLGFEGCCADREHAMVGRGSDPYWLGRVYPTRSLRLLKFRTSGVGGDLRRRFG